VSFYAFRDDSLYQNNQKKQKGIEDDHKIATDATIIVETLLSATVHDVGNDSLEELEENVTISFQLLKVSLIVQCVYLLYLLSNCTNFCEVVYAYKL